MTATRRTILQGAAALGAATGIAGFSHRASAAESIKIGCPVNVTGALGSVGTQMRQACEFWAKQVNASGGILGRPVELVVQDTHGDPATTVRLGQEMVDRDHVKLFTCIVASNEALAVCPKLAEWDAIFVSGDNGDGSLTAQHLVPNFFRPNTSGPMGTRAVALWLRDSKMTKFYGIGMDYAWGHDSVNVFAEQVKKAGKQFLGAVFSPTGTKDFSTYITKIRESGAQGCYLVLAGDDNNAFLSQAHQYRLGNKVQLLTEQVDEAGINAVGDAAIGLIGGSRYSPTIDNQANKAFVAAWQKEYGRLPQMFEGDQYQSCVMLQKGIEKAGALDTAKIRTALEGLAIDSVKGHVVMRACDHQAEQAGLVVKVVKKPGMAKPVPEVIATYPADKITPACNKGGYDD